ncbi:MULTISPECIES: 30S ribosomal protein S1 [Reichenbachiella]|uniref:Small ribosomal subunit protein bS1 n=1 Tax=Reichenbachiella agariperforans TaxID=156994 RepID=A0A1M6V3E0_REIAG|nr:MULTISPECIES: 30S ribosomal protein S1 [Reichenbachiella]MBU2912365.1 30S ribosomal protein S1 [Reichenbachiella agariperforans]SHK76017.1 small subunit ribosomal protein S1 [Reichenbachiella agariperforans]
MAQEEKEVAKEEVTEKATEATPVAETATEEVAAEKPAKKVVVEEEFDWDNIQPKGFGDGYSKAQKEDLEALYGDSLNTIEEKEVVKGVIVSMTARDVIINIGFKSDGLVSASEFRDQPDLKAGDEVEVFIEEQEDNNGQLVLSRRKAKIVSAWENIQKSFDQDLVIDGMVKRRTKGGLIVDIFGVEAFLPGSQIDVKPIRDFDIFVDKKMEVKVVKINYTNDNVVVSHKILIEKDLEKQKAQILENLEKGQVLEGVIKNMTNFGVFIDLGGVDGLLHITDISWGRVNHPEEVLDLDAKVNVVVLDFDDDKKRISLGMKQLSEHPWDSLDATVEIGTKVKGKIVNVADYGAFLEIQPGVEGLIHVSEMSWSQHLRNPQDFINIGDELEAVVLTIDRDDRKMSLGIKQLTEDPWTKQDVLTKYAVGTDHKGVVRNLTNFGLFIELEEGIDGLVHVSDLSWTKKIKHPSEFVSVNEELEVRVLELDVDNRRLALGHKQLEENPWDTFETVFSKGTTHKCTVNTIIDKGAILELPYGLEGFSSTRNLKKEDGSTPAVGDSLDFVVIDFSKDERRIALSHVGTYSDHIVEKAPAKPAKKGGKGGQGGQAISKLNSESEKSTLGDLAALTALKEQMEGGAKKPAAKKEEGDSKDESAK